MDVCNENTYYAYMVSIVLNQPRGRVISKTEANKSLGGPTSCTSTLKHIYESLYFRAELNISYSCLGNFISYFKVVVMVGGAARTWTRAIFRMAYIVRSC